MNGGKRLLLSLYCIAAASAFLLIGTAFLKTRDTGTLKVSASSNTATLAISQNNREAKIIGRGSIRIRIATGTYYLTAGTNGQQTSTFVTVRTKQVTTAYLNLQQPTVTVPSVDNIIFTNLDSLVNDGLSSAQVKILRQALFMFKPSATTISVDPNSITAAQPQADSIVIVYAFSVNIDGGNYTAKFTATGILKGELALVDLAAHKQVYDSGVITQPF